MELPDDIFTPITAFASDESQAKSTNSLIERANLLLEDKTDSENFTMSPVQRALDELDKFVEGNENAIEEAINQPSVHDSFKQLKVDVDNGNNSKLPDSPRPKKRSISNLQ